MLLVPSDMSGPGHPNQIGMTVSHSESVKSEFRSNHTSQYNRPSNSLRDLSKRFAI